MIYMQNKARLWVDTVENEPTIMARKTYNTCIVFIHGLNDEWFIVCNGKTLLKERKIYPLFVNTMDEIKISNFIRSSIFESIILANKHDDIFKNIPFDIDGNNNVQWELPKDIDDALIKRLADRMKECPLTKERKRAVKKS